MTSRVGACESHTVKDKVVLALKSVKIILAKKPEENSYFSSELMLLSQQSQHLSALHVIFWDQSG